MISFSLWSLVHVSHPRPYIYYPTPAITSSNGRWRTKAKSNSTPKSPNSNGDALHSRLLHQSPPFVPRRHPQSPTQALNQPFLPPDPCLHQPIRQSPSSSSIPPPPSQIRPPPLPLTAPAPPYPARHPAPRPPCGLHRLRRGPPRRRPVRGRARSRGAGPPAARAGGPPGAGGPRAGRGSQGGGADGGGGGRRVLPSRGGAGADAGGEGEGGAGGGGDGAVRAAVRRAERDARGGGDVGGGEEDGGAAAEGDRPRGPQGDRRAQGEGETPAQVCCLTYTLYVERNGRRQISPLLLFLFLVTINTKRHSFCLSSVQWQFFIA